MTFKKIIAGLVISALCTLGVSAQTNGSNSSYSRFGLGTMNDQSQGFNRAMGGVSQGLRSGTMVNMQNPASYSAIDSLTFIFDVGMGLQYGHLKQGGNSVNVRNTTLDYVNAGFRLAKGLGMSFGFVPYSTIGYNFQNTSKVGSDYTTSQNITCTTTYYGNGGLHQMYAGIGWNPFAKLNIGANISYIWGDYNNSLSQTFYEGASSNTNYNTAKQEVNSDVKTYKVDLGLQYPIRLTHQDWLTLGATASLGHTIKSDVKMIRYTSGGDTIESKINKAFDLPYTFGGGLSWQHQGRIIVAADYFMEKWAGSKVPVASTDATLDISTDEYLDRHRIVVGAEYTKNPLKPLRYGDRIQYKLGASYATPHVKVNGQDGPKEMSVSAGVGLPLTSSSRSTINVSLQWLKRSPSVSSMISENYFMVHLGVTFNERWFMKWKIQ